MNQPSYIVFLCFGDEGFFYECAFAMLSLSRLCGPGQLPCSEVWVYTDNPGWFSRFNGCSLPVHYRTITAEEARQWRGSIGYQYRAKIEVLKDFTATHEGNILYFDTDVVVGHAIGAMLEAIARGQAYMHSLDGIVSTRATPMLSKLDSHLRATNAVSSDGKPLCNFAMWNSGVIGYNTCWNNFAGEVLQLMDAIYPRNHSIRVIEQFAVSVKLQEQGNIMAAAPYVLHYWNLREARAVLARFFAHFSGRQWDELAQLSGLIRMFELMMEKVRYGNHQSIAARLLNKPWIPPAMDWDELEKQL